MKSIVNVTKSAIALLLVAVSATAQQKLDIQMLQSRQAMSGISEARALVERVKLQNERKGLTRSMVCYDDLKKEVVKKTAATRAGESPIAYYEADPGVYHLVPGFWLVDDEVGEVTNCGYLAPVTKPFKFTYKTFPGVESGEPTYWDWAFDQTTAEGETLETMLYPYQFIGNYSIPTPELYVGNEYGESEPYSAGTLTLQTTDGKNVTLDGMVSLMGSGLVYNMDVMAYPGISSSMVYSDASDVWGSVFFGPDSVLESSYIEIYDAPAGGEAALFYTYVPIMAPAATDLTGKTFSVAYFDITDDGQLEFRTEVDIPDSLLVMTTPGTNVNEWVGITPLEEPLMFKGRYAIAVSGPQDGTKWALSAQLDRMELGLNPELCTAYQIPMKGEYAGYLMPVLYYQNSEGETDAYPTSMEVYNRVAYPWFMMITDEYMLLDSINAGTEDAMLTAKLACWYLCDSLTAVSDVEWLSCELSDFTVDNGEVSDWVKNITINISALPADMEGRIGHITFKDKFGYTQVMTFIQGDLAAGVDEAVVAGSGVAAVMDGDMLNLTYAEAYSGVTLLNTAGQVVHTYDLAEGGHSAVSVAELPKGIYLVKFEGVDTKTVKVVK